MSINNYLFKDISIYIIIMLLLNNIGLFRVIAFSIMALFNFLVILSAESNFTGDNIISLLGLIVGVGVLNPVNCTISFLFHVLYIVYIILVVLFSYNPYLLYFTLVISVMTIFSRSFHKKCILNELHNSIDESSNVLLRINNMLNWNYTLTIFSFIIACKIYYI